MNALEILDQLELRRRREFELARAALIRLMSVQGGAMSAQPSAVFHDGSVTTKAPSMMTLSDIADECQVHLATVKRAVKAGRLPVVKVEGSTRVLREDFEAYRSGLRGAGVGIGTENERESA